METKITVKHITLEFETSFDLFCSNLMSLLGRIQREDFRLVLSDPKQTKAHLASLGGFEDLILFGSQEHGTLLNLAGKAAKAIQYHIGNPLTALSMTVHDIRAALYAPLRVLVYESDDEKTVVEYDLPSSLFGQFGNNEVLSVSEQLDSKLAALLAKASTKN